MSRSWICMVLRDWTMRLPNRVQAMETHVTCLLRWRDVLLGLLGAFAKEIGFHLLHNEFLVLFLPGLQAVFVEQHLHVLLPLLPSQLRYVFVDALSQGAVKGRLVEALHFAPHFYAVHHPCHAEPSTAFRGINANRRFYGNWRAERSRVGKSLRDYKFEPKASKRPSQSFTTNSRECHGVLASSRTNSKP